MSLLRLNFCRRDDRRDDRSRMSPLFRRRRRRTAGQTLPVTVGEVVAPHVVEARPIGAGDDVDLDADPAVSGVTARTGPAMGSARCVTAIGAGIARGVMVARGRRSHGCCHYGNYRGITARDLSEKFANFVFFFFLFFRGRKFRVSGARLPCARCASSSGPASCVCK